MAPGTDEMELQSQGLRLCKPQHPVPVWIVFRTYMPNALIYQQLTRGMQQAQAALKGSYLWLYSVPDSGWCCHEVEEEETAGSSPVLTHITLVGTAAI